MSDAAAGRRLETGDDPERGALSAARRTDEHHELAVGDLKIEIAGRDMSVGIGLPDSFESHGCHGYPFTAPAVSPWTIRRWNASTSSATGAVATIGRREDLAPRHLILSTQQRDRDRHGLPLRPEREREREEEFVPAVHEGEDRGGRESRAAPAARLPHGRFEAARPIHHRRLLELGRQLAEDPDQQPDGERHGEGEVRKNEPGIGVDEVERAQQQVQRRDDRDLGKHADGEDEAEQQHLAPEPQPRERVGTERTDGHAEHRRRSRHDQRISDRDPEVRARRRARGSDRARDVVGKSDGDRKSRDSGVNEETIAQ